MKKMRIDILMVEKGLIESLAQAQRLVMAGQVRVNGQVVQKPSVSFQADTEIEIDPGPDYVSRGGEKLQAALEKFGIEVGGLVCADVGASTGGFTDCLIKHGVCKVYSIDVGKGILHWKLRQNNKVVVMEGVNARYLERLPEGVDLVTIDASFISSKVLLPVVQGWFRKQGGQVILLIKPQFEAGRAVSSRGKGVIRDPGVHQQVLHEVLEFAQENKYQIAGLVRSPLIGPKGNVEFLAWLQFPWQSTINVQKMIEPLIMVE
ncbi:MAG TPA: TlyA family RNA methyltransferase [Anaerolineales bacterium]|nr:TlyA family RNA methyltransferase [Anaerolineales bacterium]